MGKHSADTPAQLTRDAERALTVAQQQRTSALKVIKSPVFRLNGREPLPDWLTAQLDVVNEALARPQGTAVGSFNDAARAFLPTFVLAHVTTIFRDRLQVVLTKHDSALLCDGSDIDALITADDLQLLNGLWQLTDSVASEYLAESGAASEPADFNGVAELLMLEFVEKIQSPIRALFKSLPAEDFHPGWYEQSTDEAFSVLNKQLRVLVDVWGGTAEDHERFDHAVVAKKYDDVLAAWRKALPKRVDADLLTDQEVLAQAADVLVAARGDYVEQAQQNLASFASTIGTNSADEFIR